MKLCTNLCDDGREGRHTHTRRKTYSCTCVICHCQAKAQIEMRIVFLLRHFVNLLQCSRLFAFVLMTRCINFLYSDRHNLYADDLRSDFEYGNGIESIHTIVIESQFPLKLHFTQKYSQFFQHHLMDHNRFDSLEVRDLRILVQIQQNHLKIEFEQILVISDWHKIPTLEP